MQLTQQTKTPTIFHLMEGTHLFLIFPFFLHDNCPGSLPTLFIEVLSCPPGRLLPKCSFSYPRQFSDPRSLLWQVSVKKGQPPLEAVQLELDPTAGSPQWVVDFHSGGWVGCPVAGDQSSWEVFQAGRRSKYSKLWFSYQSPSVSNNLKNPTHTTWFHILLSRASVQFGGLSSRGSLQLSSRGSSLSASPTHSASPRWERIDT